MIKQPTKKKTVKKTDPLDLQTPPDQIDKAPESAMQVTDDPPRVVEEIPRKNPNGNPFDTMYARQRKAR